MCVMFSGKVAYFYKPLQMYENSWRTGNKYTIYSNISIKIFIFASNVNTGTYKTISLLQNYKTK